MAAGGRRRRDREPGRPLHPVPRADGEPGRRRVPEARPRRRLSFGGGADQAPVAGSVSVAPASPPTNQTLTATPSGFSDPDGDPLTYHYQWLRNGTPIPGATTATLDLRQPATATAATRCGRRSTPPTGRGAASDAVGATVTVANTAPTAGTVTVKPASPATNDVVKAVPGGYADMDVGELTYSYQWLRNGTPISGATARDAQPRAARQRRSR